MNPPAAIDSLLVHADFVRRIAEALVGRAAAEDLCQETWVAALQHPPADASKPRSWLSTVVRNLFRDERRRQLRQALRERGAAAGDPAVPAAAEIVAREELRRQVVAAVMALPSELRDVVLLRYYEDLDSAAIGARLGRPAGTVRWQLHQAVQQLRRRLDGEHGERRAWAVPLSWWAKAQLGTVAAVFKATWPLRAAFAAVLVLAIGWLALPQWLGTSPPPPVPLLVAVASPVPADSIAGSPALDRRTDLMAAAAAPAEGPEDLWGRVVRAADDTPVADAEVRLQHRDADEFECLDLDYSKQIETLATTRSDRNGRFAFRVTRARSHRLSVRVAGCAETRVRDCTGGAEVVVHVAPPAAVEGTVRFADAAAAAGVQVQIVPQQGGEPLQTSTTAADGSFRCDQLPAGGVRVVVPDHLQVGLLPRLQLCSGETAHIDLLLEPGRTARGIVTDALTHAPIAGAEVSGTWTFAPRVRTAVDGRYELRELSSSREILARAPGYARERVLGPSSDGEFTADIALLPAAGVAGRFVGRDGAPLSRLYAAAVTSDDGCVDWQPAEIAADGRFRIDGLHPRMTYQLYVRGDGVGSRVYVLPRGGEPGERLDLGDILLLPQALLEGSAVDSTGRPLAGAEVSLRGQNADAYKLLADPGPKPAIVYQLVLHSARAAADGSFRFAGLAGGSYQLLAHQGSRSAKAGPFDIGDGELRSGIEVVVDVGLSISGRVRIAGQRELPAHEWFQIVAQRGGGEHTYGTARVTTDGSFCIEQLAAGDYVLRAMHAPAGQALVAVRGIAAGTMDVDLSLQPAALVTGQVVDANGKPVAARVGFSLDDDLALPWNDTRSDAEGRFRLEVPPGWIGHIAASCVDSDFNQAIVDRIAAGTEGLVIKLPRQQ